MIHWKKAVTSATVALLLFGISTTASAVITETLDSADFAWKYEFNTDGVLPSAEDIDSNSVLDWTAAGNVAATVSAGVMNYNMSDPTKMCYFMSSNAGQAWLEAAPTNTTGYTLEIRAKVNSLAPGANTSVYLQSFMAGTDRGAGWLNLTPTGQTWGTNRLPVFSNDNSDDYHVFRMAKEANSPYYSLWRDNVLLCGNLRADFTHATLNRLLFGDAGSVMGGDVDLDYIRFTAGAYAPTNVVAAAATPPSISKSSADFNFKYEMNADITNKSAVDLDGNDVVDWTANGSNFSFSGGTLTSGVGTYFESGISNTGHFWPVMSATDVEGFTVEMNVRVVEHIVNGDIGRYGAAGLVLCPADSTEVFAVDIAGSGLTLYRAAGGATVSVADNTDAFHQIRVSRDPNSVGGRWWVWRDGELLTPVGVCAYSSLTRNALYFGDMGNDYEGTIEVDYVRIMEGSFSPGATTPLVPGDANGDYKVNAADAAKLAENWLQAGDWWMGDFNDDGMVNDKDAALMAANWGYGTESASVPEPGILTLLLLTVPAFAVLRRKAA